MAMGLAVVRNTAQSPGIPFLGRALVHNPLAMARLPPYMKEPQEGKRRSLGCFMLAFGGTLEAEVHEARLRGMEPQAKLGQAFLQDAIHPLAIQKVFEHQHEVITKADQRTALLHPGANTLQ